MHITPDAADDFPAFQLGLRRTFLNLDLFAGLEGVGFVMGVELRRPTNGLLQQRVQIGALDLHDDGFVALIAHDGSGHYTARHRLKLSLSVTSHAARSARALWRGGLGGCATTFRADRSLAGGAG